MRGEAGDGGHGRDTDGITGNGEEWIEFGSRKMDAMRAS